MEFLLAGSLAHSRNERARETKQLGDARARKGEKSWRESRRCVFIDSNHWSRGFRFSSGGHCTRRGSLYPTRTVRQERSNRARASAPSRGGHAFIQRAPGNPAPGRKSATRNGWANFLFRSASGHAPRHIGMPSYYMHIHIHTHIRISVIYTYSAIVARALAR